MSMNIRTFLAILLSFLVVFVYQYFFAKNLETQKQDQTQTQTQAQPGQQQAAAPAAAPGAPAVKAPVAKASPAARDIRIETPLYTAVFSTRGGALKSFMLKQYKATLAEDSPLIEMVQVQEGSELPLSTAFADSSVNLPGDVLYETDRKELDLTKDAKPGTLVFSLAVPGQYRVEKVYTFNPERYAFDLEVRFQNNTNVALNQNL
ncbi:MAG TPA: membrane protein insertase YidC, partial [Syntrophales bacterium]